MAPDPPSDDVLRGSPFAEPPAAAAVPSSPRRSVAVARCDAVLMLALGLSALLAAIDIESIVGSGPLLCLVASGCAIPAAARREWRSLLLTLSVPAAAVGFFLVIFLNDWSPGEAQQPIGWAIAVYGLAWTIIGGDAIRAALKIVRPAKARQFSLAWLLGLLTLSAVMLGVVRWLGGGVLPAVGGIIGAAALPRWVGGTRRPRIGFWLGLAMGLLLGGAAAELESWSAAPQRMSGMELNWLLAGFGISLIAGIDIVLMGRRTAPAQSQPPLQ